MQLIPTCFVYSTIPSIGREYFARVSHGQLHVGREAGCECIHSHLCEHHVDNPSNNGSRMFFFELFCVCLMRIQHKFILFIILNPPKWKDEQNQVMITNAQVTLVSACFLRFIILVALNNNELKKWNLTYFIRQNRRLMIKI